MNYDARKTTLGILQGPEAGPTIFPNLPRSGFFAVFHREQKLSRTKIANQLILIKKRFKKPCCPIILWVAADWNGPRRSVTLESLAGPRLALKPGPIRRRDRFGLRLNHPKPTGPCLSFKNRTSLGVLDPPRLRPLTPSGPWDISGGAVPSSSGLGHRPLTAETRVRFPLGLPR